jgi:uncharacterized OB-fold protein
VGVDRTPDLNAVTDDVASDWVPDRWLVDGEDGAPTLLGGWSPTSGRHHFPPASVCPYGGVDDVEVVPLSRHGRLWAWTAVTAAPPGYEGPVPYGFGVVELESEGLRLVTRLTEPDPAKLSMGQSMDLVAEELPSGRRIWAFAPAEGDA